MYNTEFLYSVNALACDDDKRRVFTGAGYHVLWDIRAQNTSVGRWEDLVLPLGALLQQHLSNDVISQTYDSLDTEIIANTGHRTRNGRVNISYAWVGQWGVPVNRENAALTEDPEAGGKSVGICLLIHCRDYCRFRQYFCNSIMFFFVFYKGRRLVIYRIGNYDCRRWSLKDWLTTTW